MGFWDRIAFWTLGPAGESGRPAPFKTRTDGRPIPRPGNGEPLEIWLMRYPNADLWSFRASLYREGGWLFKYPDAGGRATYGFKTYEEADREVREAGYTPVRSERIDVVDLDAGD